MEKEKEKEGNRQSHSMERPAHQFYVKVKYTQKNARSMLRTSTLSRPSQSRNHNTVSMYVQGQDKILPSNLKVEPGQQCQTPLSAPKHHLSSTHYNQRKQESISGYRYKKVDVAIESINIQNPLNPLNGTSTAQMANVNPLKEFRRKTKRASVLAEVRGDQMMTAFLQLVEEMETEFVQHCYDEVYEKAAQTLVTLLNYSVDFNLPEHFSRSLKALGDLYILIGRTQESLFFYNEARESALLLSQAGLLIESLIGMANCCGKEGLEKEAIVVLKKALEYAWLNDLRQMELKIYDQIGKKYYHLGDIDKAKRYHHRYINSLYEPVTSALKNLSKQRIKKSEQINIEMRYNELSLLFLVHLKIPIKSYDELPLHPNLPANLNPIRNNFNINKKYFTHYQQVDAEMRKILSKWQFAQEIQEPNLPEEDWTVPVKAKKFAYIDFKLNQHLSKFSQHVVLSKSTKAKDYKVKESLQEKIARKIKEQPMPPDWYERIIQQISRDHKNKLLNVRHAVRIRGFNKKIKPSIEIIKQIYNCYFEGGKQLKRDAREGKEKESKIERQKQRQRQRQKQRQTRTQTMALNASNIGLTTTY